ncbi:hypothetical protein [Dictyobacter vulcani]|uniref:hypothetical protein n=1 Tax=Dictyobacter vulcani TaxID=2607529 RepID=UPI0012502210|nr:hypothetical protein [Dictyobacter vulcani]
MVRQISFFFICCCLLVATLSGCSDELASDPGQQGLILVACHREDAVGLLFMRMENRNTTDLHSASMQISFPSLNASKASVSMHVAIPAIPSIQERLVTINVPTGKSNHYAMPDGPLTVQLQLPQGFQQPETTYATTCYDPQ